MFTLLYGAAVAATLIGLGAWLGVRPRALASYCARFPGTLFVGSAHGAFIALGLWAGAMVTPWELTTGYLALTAVLWLGVHVLLEEHAARPADRKRRLRSGRT
ncbi:hypothetical protein KCMC57_64590 (plasmid) [Kitasatospora sp. CMC57]|uniref:Uncharacterized protein n=1 Tax=Kitasatospora sp. CMC57 TaxID=3231513 RepID=A0AB33K3M7_9ACTN